MRKFLFFCILLYFPVNLSSQNIHIARHGKVDRVYNLTTIHSKSFYIYTTGGDSVNLEGIDKYGQSLFEKQFSYGLYNTIKRLHATKDKALALLGYSDQCDVFGDQNERNFLAKVDTNGAIQFIIPIQFFYGSSLDQAVDFTQHLDSSYYIVSDSLLYHYSKTGSFISRISTGLNTIKSIVALNNGNLVLNCKINNIQKNVIITPSASLIAQQTTSNLIGKFIQTPSTNIFDITNFGSIEKLSSTLSVINSSSNTVTADIHLTDFTIRNDSTFAVGTQTASTTPVYLILDQNLNILYQTPLSTYSNVLPTGITINNENKINVIARSSSATNTYITFSSYFQFPLTGNYTSSSDIGVVDFSQTGYTVYPYSPFSYYALNVVIKNFSTDTVKNFYLNAPLETNFCFYVQLHKYYNTPILPNGTVTVQTGSFISTQFNPNICLFTTIPNSLNDINIANDAYCKQATGLEQSLLSPENIFLFPNPFTNKFSISSTFRVREICIYNLFGALIKKETSATDTPEVDTRELPAGIYFVKLQTEKGYCVKKVVKE